MSSDKRDREEDYDDQVEDEPKLKVRSVEYEKKVGQSKDGNAVQQIWSTRYPNNDDDDENDGIDAYGKLVGSGKSGKTDLDSNNEPLCKLPPGELQKLYQFKIID